VALVIRGQPDMTGRKLPEYNLYFSNPVGLAGIVFGFKGHPSQSMIEGNSGALLVPIVLL